MRIFLTSITTAAIMACGFAVFSGQGHNPQPAQPATRLKPPPSSADEFVEVTEQALKSAVKVMIFKPQPRLNPVKPFVTTNGAPDSIGSGVVYKTRQSSDQEKLEVLILTNHHVIDGAKTINVRFSSRLEYTAEAVGTDPITEVAVLRIRVSKEKAPPAIHVRKTAPRIAEKVLAIGSPLDQPFTVSSGIVSALGRRPAIIKGNGSVGYEDFLQTDAPVNPGNSGGPLIDARAGSLIGINTAILGHTNLGIGYAIPSDLAVEVAERMLSNKGRAWHGFAGLQIDDTEHGVKVLNVVHARSAPPIKVNDLLLKINGQDVTDARTCRRLFDRIKPGSKAKININRNGKPIEVELTIQDFENYFFNKR